MKLEVVLGVVLASIGVFSLSMHVKQREHKQNLDLALVAVSECKIALNTTTKQLEQTSCILRMATEVMGNPVETSKVFHEFCENYEQDKDLYFGCIKLHIERVCEYEQNR